MAKKKEEKSESSDDDGGAGRDRNRVRLGGDTRRIKILKEIGELSHIPEFQDILATVLDEIKGKYPERIYEYRDFKKNLEKEFGEEIDKKKGKSKSFYFELNKVDETDSPSGGRWELGEFKLNVCGNIVNLIFAELTSRLDEYETNPSRIQQEIVYSYPLNQWFRIDFTKSSDTRVIGFVKILDDDQYVYNNSRIVKMTVNPKQVIHKEKLMKLMDDNPEFSRSMYLALKMRDYSTQSQSV